MAARDGYKTFGIQFWGVCWASRSVVRYADLSNSNDCSAVDYAACKRYSQMCVGKDYGSFLYAIG